MLIGEPVNIKDHTLIMESYRVPATTMAPGENNALMLKTKRANSDVAMHYTTNA